MPSALLTNFNHKSITVDAAVLLPQNYYTSPSKKYPVIFTIAGFGGNYHRYSGNEKINSTPIDSTECITVYLDGNCSLGHSTYANSDNNGPWGDALTQEFIPALEKQFRCNGALLLKGHSSGGFAALWLQTHYPKVFAGCAASSPDPVDFRCFFNINLYTDKNMFYDKDSSVRHLGNISGAIPFLKASDYYRMEHVISRGEQFHSYDAVYSRKNIDGMPTQICNPATGEIDSVTLADWKRYDISLFLVSNWKSLQTDLDSKVRLSAGINDNYFLNTSVSLLEQEMKKLNSKFVFAYYPGDHITVQTPAYKQDQSLFLEQKYIEWKIKHPGSDE